MNKQFKDFLKNEEGAEALEYVVIVAVIIVIGAAAYTPGLSNVISTAFSAMTDAVGTATTPAG